MRLSSAPHGIHTATLKPIATEMITFELHYAKSNKTTCSEFRCKRSIEKGEMACQILCVSPWDVDSFGRIDRQSNPTVARFCFQPPKSLMHA